MALREVTLADLRIDDERSFRHVGLYGALKQTLLQDDVRFAVLEGSAASDGAAALLNLGFWRPGGIAEILPFAELSADQLAHNAWHHVVHAQLGAAAESGPGLLLAEAIASAFDVYLVGRVLGHAPDALFLQTQVPAMADACMAAGMSDAAFEQLLQRMSEEPEAVFEALRCLLFDVALELLTCADASAASAVLDRHDGDALAPLLHHYELPTWVLFARCYGRGGDAGPVHALDEALRQAACSLDLLEQRWLTAAG